MAMGMEDVDPDLIKKLTEVDIMSEFPAEVRNGIKNARIQYFALFDEFKDAVENQQNFDEVFAKHSGTYCKDILDDKADRIRALEPHKQELMVKILDSIFSMSFAYHGMTIHGSLGGKPNYELETSDEEDNGEKKKKAKKHKKSGKKGGKKKGKRGKGKKQYEDESEKWTGRPAQESYVKTVRMINGRYRTFAHNPEQLELDYGKNRYYMNRIYEKMRGVCGAIVDIMEADFYQSRDHVFKGLADIFAKLAAPIEHKEENFEKMKALVELVSSTTQPKRDYSMYGGEIAQCVREQAKQARKEREEEESESGVIVTDITDQKPDSRKSDESGIVSDDDSDEETTCTCDCHGPCPCCCSGCYPINHRDLIEKNGGEDVKIVKKGIGVLPAKESDQEEDKEEESDVEKNEGPKIEEIFDNIDDENDDKIKLSTVTTTNVDGGMNQDTLFHKMNFRNSVNTVNMSEAIENDDDTASVKSMASSMCDADDEADDADVSDPPEEEEMNQSTPSNDPNNQSKGSADDVNENEAIHLIPNEPVERSFDSSYDESKESASDCIEDKKPDKKTKKKKTKKEREDEIRANFNDSDNCSHCCCHCGCNRSFDIEMPDVEDFETFANVFNEEMKRFSPANRGFLFNIACTMAQPNSHILLKQKVVEVGMVQFLKLLKELKVDYQLYVVELVFKIVMSMQVARKFCFRDPDYFPALARLLGVVDPCKNRDRNQLRGDAAHVLYVSLMGSGRENFEKVAQTNAFDNLVTILYEEPHNERDVQSGEDVFSCFNLFTDEWDLFIHDFQAAPMNKLIDRWRRYALEYTSYLPNFIWMLESLKKRLICIYQAHRVSRPEFRLHKTFNADKLREHNQIGCSNPKCYKMNFPELGCKYKKCSKCHLAYYCSKECQLAHWRKHKKYCEKPDWLIEEEKQAKIDTDLKNIDFGGVKIAKETEITTLVQASTA